MRELKVVDFGDVNCPPRLLGQSHETIRQKNPPSLARKGAAHSLGWRSLDYASERHSRCSAPRLRQGRNGPLRRPRLCWDTAYGGVLASHASPMRRLLESGAIPDKNFVQVGLRSYWPERELLDWMKEKGMRWHLMAEIEVRGFRDGLEQIISEALDGPEII